MKGKRIGILGGTFNPLHIGHLVLAQEAALRLGLDKVIFIPAYIPPHKKIPDCSADMRYRMTVLACQGNPVFEASPIEMKKRSVSYSIETLKTLKKKYGKNTRLFFLLGADNKLGTWKDIKKALDLADFVVANRSGSRSGRTRGVRRIKMASVDISSSSIRRIIRKSGEIRYLVPEPVRRFIQKHRLYK